MTAKKKTTVKQKPAKNTVVANKDRNTWVAGAGIHKSPPKSPAPPLMAGVRVDWPGHEPPRIGVAALSKPDLALLGEDVAIEMAPTNINFVIDSAVECVEMAHEYVTGPVASLFMALRLGDDVKNGDIRDAVHDLDNILQKFVVFRNSLLSQLKP